MIFTTRSRTGLGIGLLVSGLLLIDSSDNRFVLAILGVLVMALGAFQIVRAYQIRDTTRRTRRSVRKPNGRAKRGGILMLQRTLGRLVGIGLLCASILIFVAVFVALTNLDDPWSSLDASDDIISSTFFVAGTLLTTASALGGYSISYLRGHTPRFVDDSPSFGGRLLYFSIALFFVLVGAFFDAESNSTTLLWVALAVLIATFVVREVLIWSVRDELSV